MWVYEKKLEYPVRIKNPNPKLAKIIISQYGGLYCKKIYILRIEKNVYALRGTVENYSLYKGFQKLVLFILGYRGRFQGG